MTENKSLGVYMGSSAVISPQFVSVRLVGKLKGIVSEHERATRLQSYRYEPENSPPSFAAHIILSTESLVSVFYTRKTPEETHCTGESREIKIPLCFRMYNCSPYLNSMDSLQFVKIFIMAILHNITAFALS